MSEIVPSEASCLPERYQRRAVEIANRVRDIDALLVPCSVEDISAAVVRLARQFRPQADEDEADMAREYRAACADLPAWAVSEATNDFLAGRVENHTGQYMPICAEFAKRARSILVPFLAERSSLRIEAGKLVERARDEASRNRIAIERMDPAVKARVASLVAEVMAGTPSHVPLRGSLDDEKRKRLDALKKPRQFVSKIGHEPKEDE